MSNDILIAVALAALTAAGCAATFWNWIFQNRLDRARSRHTIKRLALIMLTATAASIAVLLLDEPWVTWRDYNILLLLLAVAAWYTFFGGRGLGLVDDKIAEAQRLREREEQATKQAFFLRAIAHDLRNPLNSVMLNASLIKSDLIDGDDTVESVEAIINASKKAAEYLSQLLDLARSVTEQTADVACTDVAALVRQTCARHAVLANSKQLSLILTVPPKAEAVTDAARLERILSNLIDNAVKYTPPGGEVAISAEARDDGLVAIRVRDTGPGIPAESVPKLFDEFFQVENHERDASQGWGLGLAICKRLAHQIGASVAVENTGATGTTFQVLLPGAHDSYGFPVLRVATSHAADAEPRLGAAENEGDVASSGRLLEAVQ
jgi:signal transduction histidine kinase